MDTPFVFMRTLKKKVEVYEQFLHMLNLGTICGNPGLIRQLVYNADTWSYAHRVGNGLSDKEQQKLIDAAFDRLLTKNE